MALELLWQGMTSRCSQLISNDYVFKSRIWCKRLICPYFELLHPSRTTMTAIFYHLDPLRSQNLPFWVENSQPEHWGTVLWLPFCEKFLLQQSHEMRTIGVDSWIWTPLQTARVDFLDILPNSVRHLQQQQVLLSPWWISTQLAQPDSGVKGLFAKLANPQGDGAQLYHGWQPLCQCRASLKF